MEKGFVVVGGMNNLLARGETLEGAFESALKEIGPVFFKRTQIDALCAYCAEEVEIKTEVLKASVFTGKIERVAPKSGAKVYREKVI